MAATNQDLRRASQEGGSRRDLYFRPSACEVRVPPLRERRDDIPILVDHFLDQISTEMGTKRPEAPQEPYALLGAYEFPGNVRELRALIGGSLVRQRGDSISLDEIRRLVPERPPAAVPDGGGLRRRD